MSIKADQTEQESPRRLRRSADGRALGGIAAGFATFFALDVTHVRIAFVVLALVGGAGLPVYLAAWTLIPEEGSDTAIVDGLLRPVTCRLS
jgi:phage shock protein C